MVGHINGEKEHDNQEHKKHVESKEDGHVICYTNQLQFDNIINNEKGNLFFDIENVQYNKDISHQKNVNHKKSHIKIKENLNNKQCNITGILFCIKKKMYIKI